jgi:beta-xylosidase
MVWTVSWHARGIGYANSPDLIHWSEQKYIPVMEHEPDAKNCWAPEIFYDEQKQQYLIFWATTIPGRFAETDNQSNDGPPAPGNNHRMYYVTTKDFETFSETKLFYDHSFNVIDATIIKDGKQYVMFLKDETNKPFEPQKNIRLAYSEAPVGPYSLPSPNISGEDWVEGPTVIKIGNKWHLYFDKYILHRYGLMVSEDLQNWTDISDQLEYPDGMRHGTAFKVPASMLENLLKVQ